MKVTGVLAGLFATSVLAAPAKETAERRTNHDLSSLNGLQSYNSQYIQYLNNVNNLDLSLFNELGSVNNLDILSFSQLFQSSSFDLVQILALQQMQMLLQLASLGLFNGYDLSSLELDSLNLGLVDNIGSLDLTQYIEQASLSQIQVVAATEVIIPGKA